MNLVVLSRSSALYSTNSIVQAAKERYHFVRVLDHMNCELIVDSDEMEISCDNQILRYIDGIVPRIGSSATMYGAAVIRQFEAMGIFTTLSSDALVRSRDKLHCLQILASHGIAVPRSGISQNPYTYSQLLDAVSENPPYIIKLVTGTQGIGVILSESKRNAEGILESYNKMEKNVIIQKYIPEVEGSDLRIFVVDGEIVASMKRQAQPGEFRSNLHRGGYSYPVEPTQEEAQIALKSVELMGLKIAGVDILQSNKGPLVLEVNASPGLEGIENTTQIDIAAKIISFVERGVKQNRKAKRK